MNKKNIFLLIAGFIVMFLGFKLRTEKYDMLLVVLRIAGFVLLGLSTFFAMKSLKEQ